MLVPGGKGVIFCLCTMNPKANPRSSDPVEATETSTLPVFYLHVKNKLKVKLNFLLSLPSFRLFGVDDDQGEGTELEGSKVTGPVQACPSYAATAALPASGPITATLTG